MTANSVAPCLGDMVHYVPLMAEVPGCRAAVVTDTHVDPMLASLMVLHSTGVQFITDVRQSECEFSWETRQPGTWHVAKH